MADKTTEANSFNWLVPSRAALVAFAVCISIALCQTDAAFFLYLLLAGPILIVFSVALLVYVIVAKDRPRRVTLLSTLAAVWIISAFIFVYHDHVRTIAKWLAWSRNYKSKVLAQPAPASGEFRHVEWDGWGWAGQDSAVFLVFDPRDSLSFAASTHQSGKFDGIPCAVPEVSRLESQWYAVRFYTNQDWNRCD